MIHISKAALCLECDHVVEPKGNNCPLCGWSVLLPLERIVNRTPLQYPKPHRAEQTQ